MSKTDNTLMDSSLGGSSMCNRKDNIKQYCSICEPMVYSATDNTTSVIAEGQYRDLSFIVINSMHKYPCAYVDVAPTKLNGFTEKDLYLCCHGGVTYSKESLPRQGEKGWWIGWDYAHWGDFVPFISMGIDIDRTQRKWTTEEVVEECLNVIDEVWVYDAKGGWLE